MPNATNSPEPASFRPLLLRMLPTLATIAGVALFVAAGHWQQGRMQEKEAQRAQQDAAAQSPPLELAELATQSDWTGLRYRRVHAMGTFEGKRQILIDNKVHDGRVGYDVVTPLTLADGRTVLVDRGWIAQGASRSDLPAAPPPEGAIRIVGRIALPASGYLELKGESGPEPVWQNLDLARFAAASGIAVLPVVIEQTDTNGPDLLVRDWPAPDSGVEKHRIYMMQWYAFAGLAAALWLYFHLRRTKEHDG